MRHGEWMFRTMPKKQARGHQDTRSTRTRIACTKSDSFSFKAHRLLGSPQGRTMEVLKGSNPLGISPVTRLPRSLQSLVNVQRPRCSKGSRRTRGGIGCMMHAHVRLLEADVAESSVAFCSLIGPLPLVRRSLACRVTASPTFL